VDGLPFYLKRKIAFRIKRHRKEFGFVDGRHWEWLTDPHKRKEAVRSRISGGHDKITSLPFMYVTDASRIRAKRGIIQPTNPNTQRRLWRAYVKLMRWTPQSASEIEKLDAAIETIQLKLDPAVALLDDPDTTDQIGRRETVEDMREVFEIIAGECLAYCKKEGKTLRYYLTLLDWARARTIKKSHILWRGRGVPQEKDPDQRDWFERLVAPDGTAGLDHQRTVRCSRGEAAELERFERQAVTGMAASAPPAVTPGKRKRGKRSGSKAERKQGYRSEIREWMDNNNIPTNADAARKLGVGPDTLKNIMSDVTSRRYSLKTLEGVLKKISGQKRG
jgi:hypothetical protein